MTETCGPVVAGTMGTNKPGIIGVPLPGNDMKIVSIDTKEEVPTGEVGEICIAGPIVMPGYLDNEKETNDMLEKDEKGKVWVHTGDLGYVDEDGLLYYVQRLKRMLIVSGYNVYPAQIENILDANPLVQMSCVIGVPDAYKMQKVKAFVKLSAGVEPSEETRESLMEYCRKNIAKYAMPYDIEFRDDMPKTLVGKVAYRVLEEEELEKQKAKKQ